MKPYETIPFTNKFGQVIHPGDRIVVVTGGRGSTVNTYDGIYLGCRRSENWRGEQIQTVVEVKGTAYSYFNQTTGAESTWDDKNAKGRWHDVMRKTTLWRNQIFKLAA